MHTINLQLQLVETVRADDVESPSGYWVFKTADKSLQFLLFGNGALHYIDDDKPVMQVDPTSIGLDLRDIQPLGQMPADMLLTDYEAKVMDLIAKTPISAIARKYNVPVSKIKSIQRRAERKLSFQKLKTQRGLKG